MRHLTPTLEATHFSKMTILRTQKDEVYRKETTKVNAFQNLNTYNFTVLTSSSRKL